MCEEGGRASVLNIDMKESLESQAYSGKIEEMEKSKTFPYQVCLPEWRKIVNKVS